MIATSTVKLSPNGIKYLASEFGKRAKAFTNLASSRLLVYGAIALSSTALPAQAGPTYWVDVDGNPHVRQPPPLPDCGVKISAKVRRIDFGHGCTIYAVPQANGKSIPGPVIAERLAKQFLAEGVQLRVSYGVAYDGMIVLDYMKSHRPSSVCIEGDTTGWLSQPYDGGYRVEWDKHFPSTWPLFDGVDHAAARRYYRLPALRDPLLAMHTPVTKVKQVWPTDMLRIFGACGGR